MYTVKVQMEETGGTIKNNNQNGVGVREREFIMNATPLRTETPSTRGGKTPGLGFRLALVGCGVYRSIKQNEKHM